MQSFLDYMEKHGRVPRRLAFSLASLMAFYTGSITGERELTGHRGSESYKVVDDADVLEFFAANSGKEPKEFAHAVLANTDFWGQDLSALAGVEETIVSYLTDIRELGMRGTMEKVFA